MFAPPPSLYQTNPPLGYSYDPTPYQSFSPHFAPTPNIPAAGPYSRYFSPMQSTNTNLVTPVPPLAINGRAGRYGMNSTQPIQLPHQPSEEKESYDPSPPHSPRSPTRSPRSPSKSSRTRNSLNRTLGTDMFRFSSLATSATPRLPHGYQPQTKEEQSDLQRHYHTITPDFSRTIGHHANKQINYGTPAEREREKLRKALIRFHQKEQQKERERERANGGRPVSAASGPKLKVAFSSPIPAPPPVVLRPPSAHPQSPARTRPTFTQTSRPVTSSSLRYQNQLPPPPIPVIRPSSAALAHLHQAQHRGPFIPSQPAAPTQPQIPFWLPLTKREGSALIDEVLDSTVGGNTHTSIKIHRQVERDVEKLQMTDEDFLQQAEMAKRKEEKQKEEKTKEAESAKVVVESYSPDASLHILSHNNPASPTSYQPSPTSFQSSPATTTEFQFPTQQPLPTDLSPPGPEIYHYYASDGSLQRTTLPPVLRSLPYDVSQSIGLGDRDPALPNLLGWVMSLHPERVALHQASARWRAKSERADAHQARLREKEKEKENALKKHHSHASTAQPTEQSNPPQPSNHSPSNSTTSSNSFANPDIGIPSSPSHRKPNSSIVNSSNGPEVFSTALVNIRSPSSKDSRTPSNNQQEQQLSTEMTNSRIPPWKLAILQAEQRQRDELKAQQAWTKRQAEEDAAEEREAQQLALQAEKERKALELIHKKPADINEDNSLMLYPLSPTNKDPDSISSLIPSNDHVIDRLQFPVPFQVNRLDGPDLQRVPKPNWRELGGLGEVSVQEETRRESAKKREELLARETAFDAPDIAAFIDGGLGDDFAELDTSGASGSGSGGLKKSDEKKVTPKQVASSPAPDVANLESLLATIDPDMLTPAQPLPIAPTEQDKLVDSLPQQAAESTPAPVSANSATAVSPTAEIVVTQASDSTGHPSSDVTIVEPHTATELKAEPQTQSPDQSQVIEPTATQPQPQPDHSISSIQPTQQPEPISIQPSVPVVTEAHDVSSSSVVGEKPPSSIAPSPNAEATSSVSVITPTADVSPLIESAPMVPNSTSPPTASSTTIPTVSSTLVPSSSVSESSLAADVASNPSVSNGVAPIPSTPIVTIEPTPPAAAIDAHPTPVITHSSTTTTTESIPPPQESESGPTTDPTTIQAIPAIPAMTQESNNLTSLVDNNIPKTTAEPSKADPTITTVSAELTPPAATHVTSGASSIAIEASIHPSS